MQRDNYYIKMTDHNVYKFTDFNLVELHSAINNFCSRFCYYDDDIYLIQSESENSDWNQLPAIEINEHGQLAQDYKIKHRNEDGSLIVKPEYEMIAKYNNEVK